MNIRLKSNKMLAVGLLLLLGAYAFMLTLFFKGPNLTEYKTVKVLESSNIVSPTVALSLDYAETEEEETDTAVGGEEDVKGVSWYCDSNLAIKPQMICYEKGYEQNHDNSDCLSGGCSGTGSGSVEVRANAVIELIEVYVPEVLFTGAYGPYDNLVSISNPSKKTAFRNASEMVNTDYDYMAHMPPGMGAEPTYGEEPFRVNYRPEVPEMTEPDKTGKMIFDSEEESGCPTVVNGGVFNPMTSNEMSDQLVDSVTPPGMEVKNREFTDNCSSSTSLSGAINLSEAESQLMCDDLIKKFKWTFTPLATFNVLDWAACHLADLLGIDYAPCNKGELVGIWVDAPFGSSKACNEEDCSIRYTEAGRLVAAPPGEASSLIPAYAKNANDYIVDDTKIVTTPCTVLITGSDNIGPVKTKCLWDISVWQHMYEIEAGFNMPGDENLIKNDEYWKRIEKEIKYREVNF